jgi:type II secretory pathway predicted ATPase ExeA
MEAPGGKLITFVFFGLPELENILALDEPLKQRVAVMCRLKAFTDNITEDYLKHRLKVAGCEEDIFMQDAVKAVHLFSNGVPRLINTVCDNALLEGFLLKRKQIDKDVIESVAVSLGLEAAGRKTPSKPRREL